MFAPNASNKPAPVTITITAGAQGRLTTEGAPYADVLSSVVCQRSKLQCSISRSTFALRSGASRSSSPAMPTKVNRTQRRAYVSTAPMRRGAAVSLTARLAIPTMAEHEIGGRQFILSRSISCIEIAGCVSLVGLAGVIFRVNICRSGRCEGALGPCLRRAATPVEGSCWMGSPSRATALGCALSRFRLLPFGSVGG
jgi:hypothetical protein